MLDKVNQSCHFINEEGYVDFIDCQTSETYLENWGYVEFALQSFVYSEPWKFTRHSPLSGPTFGSKACEVRPADKRLAFWSRFMLVFSHKKEWGSTLCSLVGRSMDVLKEKMQELVNSLQVKVVNVSWQRQSGKKVLEVMIASPQGVDMELCSQVSQIIDPYIDETLEEEDYYLDVCSCGAERYLVDAEDAKRQLGAYVNVNFKEAQAGLMSFKGYLGIKDDKFTLAGFIKGRKKTIEFDYQAVAKMQLSVKI